jgi:hypothetical protein
VTLPDGFIWVSLACVLKIFMRFDTVWAKQYRAVLAMKGDFLIYAPSSEGMEPLAPDAKMPFQNFPFKKCQITTFAQKEYQPFDWHGTQSVKHKLTDSQLAEAIAQCNAKAPIEALLTG